MARSDSPGFYSRLENSVGARTLLAFRQNDKAFFIYGFEKNECANVSDRELKALKLLAKELLKYPAMTLTKAGRR